MSTIKMIKVSDCMRCPYQKESFCSAECKNWSVFDVKQLMQSVYIPEWCPLADFEQQKEKEKTRKKKESKEDL